ncbi:hypothetical protein OPV22_020129 [Ensete ventricosum]|uniref:Uncharacterized protein n=1 Tax=Ensete ventricosum TaxID=4639 RepID=A0AAV8QKP2_ENSVE|nr:hypothetical protein OPV22_020129 [Ensete ventricosum]
MRFPCKLLAVACKNGLVEILNPLRIDVSSRMIELLVLWILKTVVRSWLQSLRSLENCGWDEQSSVKLVGCFIGKCSGSIRSIARHPEFPMTASCAFGYIKIACGYIKIVSYRYISWS